MYTCYIWTDRRLLCCPILKHQLSVNIGNAIIKIRCGKFISRLLLFVFVLFQLLTSFSSPFLVQFADCIFLLMLLRIKIPFIKCFLLYFWYLPYSHHSKLKTSSCFAKISESNSVASSLYPPILVNAICIWIKVETRVVWDCKIHPRALHHRLPRF